MFCKHGRKQLAFLHNFHKYVGIPQAANMKLSPPLFSTPLFSYSFYFPTKEAIKQAYIKRASIFSYPFPTKSQFFFFFFSSTFTPTNRNRLHRATKSQLFVFCILFLKTKTLTNNLHKYTLLNSFYPYVTSIYFFKLKAKNTSQNALTNKTKNYMQVVAIWPKYM